MYKLLFYIFNCLTRLYWVIKYKYYRERYDIHPSFRFNGDRICFYGKGNIFIGEKSYVGEYTNIQADKDCNVIIGKNCMISHNVRIYSSSAIADQDFSEMPIQNKYGDVVIGDYVWIGANVFINPGIIISDNSIIGANSVVTKNVEQFAIVGGVPAKLIRFKALKNRNHDQ